MAMRRACEVCVVLGGADESPMRRGFVSRRRRTFPFVFDSASSGMYAISLHGSKSEYFADLESTFCAAPTTTASMSGVVPSAAISGRSASLKRMRPKKMPGGMGWRAVDMPEVVEVAEERGVGGGCAHRP